MTRLIWGIKSTDVFEEKIDNFRKFVTSGVIQTVIISLRDTCSPQGQLWVCGYSALETHFLISY